MEYYFNGVTHFSKEEQLQKHPKQLCSPPSLYSPSLKAKLFGGAKAYLLQKPADPNLPLIKKHFTHMGLLGFFWIAAAVNNSVPWQICRIFKI